MGRAVSEHQAHRAHSFYRGLHSTAEDTVCVCMSVWGTPGTAFPSLSQRPSPWRASLIVQLVKNPPAVQEIPVQFLGGKDLLEKELGYPLQYSWASLVAHPVKNPPAMQETWVRSLGWEDPLEKGKATHSSILA